MLKEAAPPAAAARQSRPARLRGQRWARIRRAPKRRNGDGRTPEGRYLLDWRIGENQSRFHRAIHISYPNDRDREFARGAGIEPGGGVMIHGLPENESWLGEAHREFDWTNGCIAVTDDEMEEIWELVDDGTPIEIRP